jgi:hypothetical protein
MFLWRRAYVMAKGSSGSKTGVRSTRWARLKHPRNLPIEERRWNDVRSPPNIGREFLCRRPEQACQDWS